MAAAASATAAKMEMKTKNEMLVEGRWKCDGVMTTTGAIAAPWFFYSRGFRIEEMGVLLGWFVAWRLFFSGPGWWVDLFWLFVVRCSKG